MRIFNTKTTDEEVIAKFKALTQKLIIIQTMTDLDKYEELLEEIYKRHLEKEVANFILTPKNP